MPPDSSAAEKVHATTDLAADFARFASTIDARQLDDTIIRAVKINILDTLSCALAGSSAAAIAEVADLVKGWAGAPQADMFVFGGKYPAHAAAWVNGSMAHARDYDDTHDAAILHGGITAVSAAIAAGQLRGKLSGADLIAAVAAGLEVTCRLGVAIKVDVMESGFNYTSLLGYFGATAAAGRALALSEEEMLNAFGIVYGSVAGNLQITRESSLMKRLLPGLAAQAAVVAVQLAKRGIRGPHRVFEGDYGLFHVYFHDRADAGIARSALGSRFELLNLSYKPYACCRNTHSAADAVLELRAKALRPASDIKRIRVGVNRPGYEMVCVPEKVRAAPRNIVEAQFSIPYSVAAAWIDGRLGLEHFTDEGVQRADLLALAARVQPYIDADIDREWSRSISPANVTIEFRDGKMLETRVDYPKGHPNNMMTEAEFAAKTADCAAFAAGSLRPDTAARLTSVVGTLESLPDIAELAQIMTP